ncbi:MAG: hypothetical protein ACTSRS_19505 [Candidatus Helarchaeota archaeon]
MIYWALLLHIYQPPFQSLKILQKINAEAYLPLLDVFLKYPNSKFTLNINGSLTELLQNYRMEETLQKIRQLANRNQVRFTGSGMYHPLLPLLPPSEVIRQINLNETFNADALGAVYQGAKGFFPPELAISKGALDIIAQAGYRWVLMSGIACPPEHPWPIDEYYTYKSIPIFFRDDIVSNEIAFKKFQTHTDFLTKIQTLFEGDYYLITAMDGETFGHHIKNYETEFLEAVLHELDSLPEIRMVFIDELLTFFKKGLEIVPRNSSWSTKSEHIVEKNPYPLWADPKNEFHAVLNDLRRLAIKLFQSLERYSAQIPEDHLEYYNNARKSLDKGENSDGAWWAGALYFSEDLVYRSSQFLLRSVLNAYKAIFSVALPQYKILEAQRLFEEFRILYTKLLQLLANHVEQTARFRSYVRKIDDLNSL